MALSVMGHQLLLRQSFVAKLSNCKQAPFATRRCRIDLNTTSSSQHNVAVLHCHCRSADTSVAETAPERQEPLRSNDKHGNDRKQPRKSAAPGPTVVVQTAEAASAGALPDVLAATWPTTFPTLSAARRVIRKDLVLVDGAVGSCKTEVASGQVLQQLEAVASGKKGPRMVSLEVVYEDDSLAVVQKPWGVKMYGGDGRRTITGALRAGALTPSPNPDALPEPKPVHRLDAAVGGLLVIAKTTSALVSLSAQWQGRRVHKVYHALLSGRLNPEAAAAQLELFQQQQQQQQQGSGESLPDQSEDQLEEDDIIASQEQQQQQQQQQPDLPLPELLQLQLQGRPAFTAAAADIGDACLEPPEATAATDGSCGSSGGSSSSSASALSLGPGVYAIDLPLEGKPCYTLYQVLGYSRAGRFGGWMTSTALSPLTGRKHQLRQHMAAAGHPIVGDGKYTNNKADHISNQGIYLESLEVSFSHPVTQQLLHITVPEPQRFATLREQQQRRWHKLEAAAAEGAAAAGGGTEAAAAAAAAAAGGHPAAVAVGAAIAAAAAGEPVA